MTWYLWFADQCYISRLKRDPRMKKWLTRYGNQLTAQQCFHLGRVLGF